MNIKIYIVPALILKKYEWRIIKIDKLVNEKQNFLQIDFYLILIYIKCVSKRFALKFTHKIFVYSHNIFYLIIFISIYFPNGKVLTIGFYNLLISFIINSFFSNTCFQNNYSICIQTYFYSFHLGFFFVKIRTSIFSLIFCHCKEFKVFSSNLCYLVVLLFIKN